MNVLEPILRSPLIDRLAFGLVHFLWEGLAIAAALAVLLPALRGRPAARHAAAWLALVLMAAAVPLTARWSPGQVRTKVAAPTTEHPRDLGKPTLGADPAAGSRPALAANLRPTTPDSPPQEPGATIPSRETRQRPGRMPVALALDPWSAIRPLAPGSVLAWLAGAVLLFLWRLGGWLYLRRLCRRESHPAPAEVQALLKRLLDRLKIRQGVGLLESAWVEVPAVVGWLAPVILLPAGLAAGIAPEQLEMLLIHELAHVRRHDFLANLVQTAIETLLFYHPAVWWVSRTIRSEREACCDDVVVTATGDRLLYARALALIEQLRAESPATRFARLPVAADGGNLLPRIRRILGLPGEEFRSALPRLAGSALVLVVTAALTGYVSVAGGPGTSKEGLAVAVADPPAATKSSERPRIVQVFPLDGATEVPSTTAIRIRFDRPMDPTMAHLEWDFGGGAGFRLRGELRYAPETHEFTLPVDLTPGQKHDVTVNSERIPERGEYEGFRSADRIEAKPHRWSFTTAKPAVAGPGPKPRVVSVDPPPDTEVALITPLEVNFDQPMLSTSYSLRESDPTDFGHKPKLLTRAEYDPRSHRFTLLVSLPPNWNGALRLEEFRGANGVAAEPYTLALRTLRRLASPALQKRTDEAARSPELRKVVADVRTTRRKLSSVSEEVVMTLNTNLGLPDWDQRLTVQGASFQMQGADKFLGNVDEIMGIPFRVGSDGTTCWGRFKNERVELPARDVDDKNVLFCDPFDAVGPRDDERIIRDLKLEYLGETTVRGRSCHRIRSWGIQAIGGGFVTPIREWSIDTATLLPMRVELLGTYMIDYTHTRINEPIPDDEFRPQTGPGIKTMPSEPLPEGYTRRFLNVNDGSSGRMSVRWGMKGPKGTNSGGLN